MSRYGSPSSPDRGGKRDIRPLAALLPYLATYRGWVLLAFLALLGASATTLLLPVAIRRMIDFGFGADDPSLVDNYFSVLIAVAAYDLVQRKLLSVRQHLYASHDYIARKGAPATPAELDDHAIIYYGPPQLAPIPGLDWAAKAGRDPDAAPRPAVIEVNTIYGVMKAVEAGMGIAALPDYVARENQKLSRVLPELDGPDFEVFFVYPSELRGSRRIVAFRDFLIEQARRWQS